MYGPRDIAVLGAAQNNKIQRKFNTIICYILKSRLANSDSFCLITSHLFIILKDRNAHKMPFNLL